jgi:phosphonate transport system substrate-binding protein
MIVQSIRWTVGLFLVLLLATGCGKPADPPSAPTSRRETLRVGLIPEQDIFKQLERYEPLAAHLSDQLEVDIELTILPCYGNIIDNFTDVGLDGAFFGSFTYALAQARLGVSVLARPVNPDGQSTYHGLIFVRRDGGIRHVEDMQGKRFVFVDKATTAGYLLPLDYFHEHGIDDFRSFLGEYYFAGTHESAYYDVLNRRADIGAAKNTVYKRLAASDPRLQTELVPLARSPEVPENALALSREIDASLRDRVKQLLLSMDADPEGRSVLARFGALRFIETTDADYEPVFRYAREVGLDLATYDYRNDQ